MPIRIAGHEHHRSGCGLRLISGKRRDLSCRQHAGVSLREAVLEQLTEDHTVGQQLVRAGLMSPHEWRTSRYRHVLTQAIGVGPAVHPTVRIESPQAGDLFLICSDGVYRDLLDEEIRAIV